jgi:hypothetical protein
VGSLEFSPSPVKPKLFAASSSSSSPSSSSSSSSSFSSSSDSLGALPYVPHHLYAGHADPPQLLIVTDIQTEIQRCIQMVADPATAQPKQFPYFLIESASGSGKTRFAFELLQWLREERVAATAKGRLQSTSMETAADPSASTSSIIHLFPHAIVCSTPLQEPVLAVGANDAAAGLRLLLQLLYQRGGYSISWAVVSQLSQSELELRVVALMRRWSQVRGDPDGGRQIWLLLIDEAQLAPRAVSAMLRAIFAWNFPAAAAPFLHSIGIIPMVVGTSSAEICAPDIIRATGYAPWKDGPLSLPFLAPFKAKQLLTNVLQKVGVQESKFLLHLASEFSGWPIAFSFLFTALSEYVQQRSSSSASVLVSIPKDDCHVIYDKIVESIATTYSAEKLASMAPDYIKQVIRMAVTGMEVLHHHTYVCERNDLISLLPN